MAAVRVPLMYVYRIQPACYSWFLSLTGPQVIDSRYLNTGCGTLTYVVETNLTLYIAAAIAGVLILNIEQTICQIQRVQNVVHRCSCEPHAKDRMQDNNSTVAQGTRRVKGSLTFRTARPRQHLRQLLPLLRLKCPFLASSRQGKDLNAFRSALSNPLEFQLQFWRV